MNCNVAPLSIDCIVKNMTKNTFHYCPQLNNIMQGVLAIIMIGHGQ